MISLKSLLNQGSGLSDWLEWLNTIDMFFLIIKFIVSWLGTIVIFVSQVNKAIVTAQGVRMDDSFRGSTLPQMTTYAVFRVYSLNASELAWPDHFIECILFSMVVC